MTDNQAQKDKLVQEGVSKHNFEEDEAVVAVETYFEESRSGESFENFLLRDGWIVAEKPTINYQLDDDDDDDSDNEDIVSYNSINTDMPPLIMEMKKGAEENEFSEGEEEEDLYDDAENDVYSSIEGAFRGMNKHGFPAVTAKVGKEAKICCKKELHEQDHKLIQKHSAQELMKAVETVAYEIDTGDFVDTEVVAGAFLKNVLHQAEKDFGILRKKFKKHHVAKVASEFLRFAEDRKPEDAILSSSKHYVGCLSRSLNNTSSHNFDRQNPFPVGGEFYDPEDDEDVLPIGDDVLPEMSQTPKRETPLPVTTEGVSHGPIEYIVSNRTLAEHHSKSQADEIWISARNIAQLAENAAVTKLPERNEKLGISLMQAAYYCSAVVATIPKASGFSGIKFEIQQKGAAATIKTMVYRALIRRELYPGKLAHLNQNIDLNQFNPKTGQFNRDGYDDFNEAVFAPKKTQFPFGKRLATQRDTKTLRQAEADIAGILQDSSIMTGQINGKSTLAIKRKAEDHMAHVIPVLLKSKKSSFEIRALTEEYGWIFVRLYASALLYQNSMKHGDWLLQRTLNSVVWNNDFYDHKDLEEVRSKFRSALQIPDNPKPKSAVVYRKSARRIGAAITLDKTRSIATTTKTRPTKTSSASLDLCKEMEASALKHLSSSSTAVNQIKPEARVVLLMPIKNSPAWRNLTQIGLRSSQALHDILPSLIIHQTGKYEFKSLGGQVYSAISKTNRDLSHVGTEQRIHFVTNPQMQRIEYPGGGPTFLIASVDLGTYASLP